jgi:hypothetical protein
MAATKSVTK